MSSADPEARAFLQSPRLPVEPGGVYLFSCRAASEHVTAGMPVLGIARYAADGSWDHWSYCLKVPPNRDWSVYRQVFTIPDTTAAVAVRVWIERFKGTAWFDDVSVQEYEPPDVGWRASFRSPDDWQVDGGELAVADGVCKLRSERQRDADTLFPIARMTCAVAAVPEQFPCLQIDIRSVRGLWALKVRQRGYIQHATAKTGLFYYDLREQLATNAEPPVRVVIEALGDLAEVSVGGVAFLSEAPPSVTAEPVRRSRYVTDALRLDGLKRGLKHPFIALSRAEIERVRGRGRDFDDWLVNCRRAAEAVLQTPVEVPDAPSVYAMEFNCPEHGVPLRWRGDFPTAHLCPVGDHVVTGGILEQQWRIQDTNRAHRYNRRALQRLGMGYAFTGDERYAERARAILLEYTERFPNYPWHSGRGDLTREGDGMRVEHEPLGEAGWLAAMARGYDLVASSPCFSGSDHDAVRAMFAEDVRVSLRYDEGLSNRQCHHNLAVASVGLILGDEFLIKRAFGSFLYQLEHAVLADGMWWECSPGYHFYALQTLLELAHTFERVGLSALRRPKLRLAFDRPLRFLLPDGTFPAVNDAHVGMKPPSSAYDVFYGMYRDPVYAGILHGLGARRRATFEYLAYGEELRERAGLPTTSHHLFHAGMGIIKMQKWGTDLCAMMDYGQTVAGHGHADKLNLVLFAGGKLRLPDIGTRSYFSPVYRFWDRQTLSHNTVVVDERSQKHERGRLTLCDLHGPVQVMQATADEAYPCVNLMRTLVLTPTFAVDLFRVADDATDARLRPGVGSVIPFWTKEPRGTSTPASIRRDLACFERSRDAHQGRYCARIAHSSDLSAAWMTELIRLTGPNREYQRGMIPVQAGVTYRLSGWIRTREATGASDIGLSWLNRDTRPIGSLVAAPLSGTHDWTEVTKIGDAPASATWVQIFCRSRDNSGSAWFDDLKLARLDAPDTSDLLASLNGDFELDSVPHRSIDYVLHGYGTLTCTTATDACEDTFGEDTDDPTYDGRNSYRYIEGLSSGQTREAWQAQWNSGADGGVRLHMLGGVPTTVFTGDGTGPGSSRLPLLMARRGACNTVFAACLEPSSAAPSEVRLKRLDVTQAGKRVDDIEAYGMRMERREGRCSFGVSYTSGLKDFGDFASDAAVAGVALAADGSMEWVYLLGGRVVRGGFGEVRVSASYEFTVLEADDERDTVVVDRELPAGVLLADSALILALPYNGCYTVASTAPHEDGSTVALSGAPKLGLRRGMRARIPPRVMLRRVGDDVYEVTSTADSEVRVAYSGDIHPVLVRADEGTSRRLAGAAFDAGLCLAVPASHRFLCAVNPPPGATLDDDVPPALESLHVDGVDTTVGDEVAVSLVPSQVTVTFYDDSGVSGEGCEVTVNGTAMVGGAAVELRAVGDAGERLAVSVTGPEAGIETLVIRAADRSLLRNELVFRLRADPPAALLSASGCSGGRAVKLLKPSVQLVGDVELPAGQYVVNLRSRASDDSANSVWIELDGERVDDPVHIRTDGFGRSSRHYDLRDELTRMSVTRDGRHQLRMSLREAPGPELDVIQFIRDAVVVCEIECEALKAVLRP